MIHAKLIRVDKRTVTLGSANLNKQAMGKLLELNVLIKNYSDDFGQALDQSIRRNLASATRISDGGKIKLNPFRARLEQLV
ncbi:MAG: phospholipase D-like domain-containing protein [Bacillota bacterium]